MPKNDKEVRMEFKKPAAADEAIDFEIWYGMRENSIPRQHYMEIIKADFKAQGLKAKETVKKFDEALIKYGVKLA